LFHQKLINIKKRIANCRERAHRRVLPTRAGCRVEFKPAALVPKASKTIRRWRIEQPKACMPNLSPRHIKTDESLRLGVVSGWYSTKVSGTFVSGPHESEADCLRRIAEIDPPPAKTKR
jgi:hypothetical protein